MKKRVDVFLNFWHQFPIDYWWRKKYKIPFGSPQHREMNFIDMFIEFQEEIIISKAVNHTNNDEDEIENRELGLIDADDRVIKITEDEIDKDFEELDLSQFDN